LYAVASRDEQRSATLEPERVHATYEDLLADEHVDAVYISLSNSQHLEWVTKSLEARKHVLCEKPLGLNATETEAMFDCASQSGRLLVEAVWGRWHPRFSRMVEVVTKHTHGWRSLMVQMMLQLMSFQALSGQRVLISRLMSRYVSTTPSPRTL
jgi:predicted dehydrogenase